LHLVQVGALDRPVPRLWVIAHQHPGETMAGWAMEGLLGRLLGEDEGAAAELRDRAVVLVVPTMNPDGSARGNHRTNAAGRDLNREWLFPDPDAAPEVFAVRRAMEEHGVDLFLDVHGEEAIPYAFAFGSEGVPSYSPRLAALEERFGRALEAASGEFQREHGYEPDPPGEADLRFANEFVAERFDCLSMGLEMPFKDNANRPDPDLGWSPDRCRRFGGSLVDAMLACVGELR
jgi:murein tripeptide amidase MpaA